MNTQIAHVTALRTPYHALGDEHGPRTPEWATRRSVYRADGHTLYLVETDHLAEARGDLITLARKGWDVQIDRHGAGASIALMRAAA